MRRLGTSGWMASRGWDGWESEGLGAGRLEVYLDVRGRA